MFPCNACGKGHGVCQCEPEAGMNCLGCNVILSHHYCETPGCVFNESGDDATPSIGVLCRFCRGDEKAAACDCV